MINFWTTLQMLHFDTMRYFPQFASFVFDCKMFYFHLNEFEWKEITLSTVAQKKFFEKEV